MRLLLIHGRAQEGKSSKVIEDEWMAALGRGFSGIGVRMPAGLQIDAPFYGDELLKQLARHDLPPADGVATRGGAMNDEYAAFLEDVAIQLRSDDKVTHREVEEEMGPVPQPRGPENWEWVQAIIRVIDRRTPGVSNYSIGQLLRDVFIYANDSKTRREINKIVAAQLTNDPTVIVAHSLGSVVAYEVLREHAGNSVPRLLTVGSPLGIRAIRDKLATPLTMPTGIRDWYNAFDDRDVVALYPLNAENFAIKPPIKNYPFVNNHTDNRHGIAGYLDDADVATQIAAALGA
ncbi:alpha/beta fold hydrolase [Bradyrhizobium sp. AUGA SZCCT0182]|uniref:alpha/beta fold hydrolase n=1 Tax=Bradyrhizobium sp. AUGA SZCCT0182 TaxID=2807667 RepID=UPI001BAB71A2|nr:hypothetical protein [Bradyrhizobium sp. AUGA SZCCT0182]MBR1234963.1 hypothetical protein [Bradyrhizobium sp. AUGA SZCCT0182]